MKTIDVSRRENDLPKPFEENQRNQKIMETEGSVSADIVETENEVSLLQKEEWCCDRATD